MMALGRFVGPSLVILDLAMLAGLSLLRRKGRSGVAVIGGFSLANLAVHGVIVVLMLSQPESPGTFVLGLAFGLAALLGVGAAVPAWRGSSSPRRLVVRTHLVLGVVLGVALIVSGLLFLTRTDVAPRPGEVSITTTGLSVRDRSPHAAPGPVTIAVHNEDPVWARSFDLPAFDVHMLIPPATTRRVTITPAPGRYPFKDSATATSATSGVLIVTP